MAYIFVLFRTKYDPATFQKEAQRITTEFNFRPVTKFGRYNFVDQINWQMVCQDTNAIYLDNKKNLPTKTFPVDGQFKLKGDEVYVYYLTSQEKCRL
jgi:hypothetical protein